MRTAQEALTALAAGNRRFMAHSPDGGKLSNQLRRLELVEGQEPFAIVLGCSDSRVPVEIVFDQGLGDLFVIRVAGNIVAPSQISSVEFAVQQFGTRLVVVLGHSNCGAIQAAVDALTRADGSTPRPLGAIVNRIRPSIEAVLASTTDRDRESLLRRAMRANIQAGVNQLRHGSEILAEAIRRDELQVVGAEYSLATGAVEFLAEHPQASEPSMRPIL